MKQIDYGAADIRTSDHRPVSALFDCTISIVNEAQKDKLRRALYDRHRAEFGAVKSKGNLLEDDDGTARSFVNSQGLPPASSDRQKWWLDNGRALIPVNSHTVLLIALQAQELVQISHRLCKEPSQILLADQTHLPKVTKTNGLSLKFYSMSQTPRTIPEWQQFQVAQWINHNHLANLLR